jgi:hypothetical protein
MADDVRLVPVVGSLYLNLAHSTSVFSLSLSLSLSITSAPVAAYSIQSTDTSASAISVFSLLVSIIIQDITISEFISW